MKKIFDRAHMNALYHEMLAHGETPEKYVMKKTGVDVETARKSLHAMREGLSDFDQLMKKPDLYLPYVQQFKQNLLNFKEDNDALRYLLCMVRPLMKAESNKPEFDALRHLDAVLAANGKPSDADIETLKLLVSEHLNEIVAFSFVDHQIATDHWAECCLSGDLQNSELMFRKNSAYLDAMMAVLCVRLLHERGKDCSEVDFRLVGMHLAGDLQAAEAYRMYGLNRMSEDELEAMLMKISDCLIRGSAYLSCAVTAAVNLIPLFFLAYASGGSVILLIVAVMFEVEVLKENKNEIIFPLKEVEKKRLVAQKKIDDFVIKLKTKVAANLSTDEYAQKDSARVARSSCQKQKQVLAQ